MKYLDYCYLCINNRKASELSENPECSNCIQLTVISMPTKFKSSRKRKSGVIVQFNKKHGRPSSEHPWEVIIPRITVIPGWISW